ncbi:hypothetical protein NL108_014276 [Boleophthalmus pectinirostris]|uniref:amphinase-3-like n=1 Tax=Boleophthalmus pectinirostris TaxID=150288 RepID=UPI002431FBEB|nr:amphinase-3-like [Boleophthalmus pectinirostris]KAJ0066518.1 hypothetical protein NL108_014276 [Boleophthalmus pectinirostris]
MQLLFALLLSAQLLSPQLLSAELLSAELLPALSEPKKCPVPGYEKFLLKHTYDKRTEVDCTDFMKDLLPKINQKQCKPCNTIITGNRKNRKTNIRAVLDVCKGKGFKAPVNCTSSTKFHVVKCVAKNPDAPLPCDYSEKPITGYITITCENGCPVHFVSTERHAKPNQIY